MSDTPPESPPPAAATATGHATTTPDPARPDAHTQVVIGDLVLAKIAAHTARHASGVARLQPGVGEMVTVIGRWGRENVTGHPELPHEGVHARTDDDGIHIGIDIVTAGTHLAATVAHQLREAVARDLTAATGLPVATVDVTVLDIDTTAGLRTERPDHDPTQAAHDHPDCGSTT